MEISKILVLSPHTDDAEFGCGGTLAKFVMHGKEIFVIAFSMARQSVSKDMDNNILAEEFIKSMSILGTVNNLLYDFPVRNFSNHRQEILELLIHHRDEFNPDLVMLPSIHDTHQDHSVIAQEGFRAFKKISMWGYELPWNNLTFETNVFVKLGEYDIDRKNRALRSYESQKMRNYSDENFINSWATFRGGQIETKYAECFESVRLII